MWGRKRVFIDEYVGLSTRLESLAMAFLISEYFGHEVCLDWHELDSLNVIGARREKRGLSGRLDSLKLRTYSDELFHRIAFHRNVCLRTHQGPPHLLGRLLLPTARRVRLRPGLIAAIRDAFGAYRGREIVGVHIRRGDFRLTSEELFDVRSAEWPAVPEWWYEHAMSRVQQQYPDAAFFVACTGSLDAFPTLTRNFDVFQLPATFAYDYKGPDHASSRHPAADLFALACCSLIIGTPCSTFTHYPAHLLGEPSTVLVPPARPMPRQQPALSKVCLYGRSAFDWYAACREGHGLEPVEDARSLPAAGPPSLDWL